MEPLWTLVYLLDPAALALISTAVAVVLASAFRALAHEREAERFEDVQESSIVLSGRQALAIPFASSFSLLLMFYLFSTLSQLVTAFTALAAGSSLAFALSPIASAITSLWARHDTPLPPGHTRPICWGLTRIQLALGAVSGCLVIGWLLSGYWVLNNILGAAICIAFVSHVRLPNVKVCAMLLACLFLYDIFWVFFSERFFGANVMVSVATQQAHNPVHTVAHHLHIPVSQSIAKKLDLPVKLLFPRNLFRHHESTEEPRGPQDFMMLGLGDMAIPGMLLALVLSFEHRKLKDPQEGLPLGMGHVGPTSPRSHRYLWYATGGYAVGLITALAAGILTRAPQPALLYLDRHSMLYLWYATEEFAVWITSALVAGALTQPPQPALLYLVPSTLGPVALAAWRRRELGDLWNGANGRKE